MKPTGHLSCNLESSVAAPETFGAQTISSWRCRHSRDAVTGNGKEGALSPTASAQYSRSCCPIVLQHLSVTSSHHGALV